MEPSANTRNAKPPSAVADALMPPSRSSNTLGRAKVVDWKTMLDTAVVRNTIIDTRKSNALMSAGTMRAAAFVLAFALGVTITHHTRAVEAMRIRMETTPGTRKGMRKPP